MIIAVPLAVPACAAPTTAHMLAERFQQTTCGRQCVDWAIGLLEQGRDGHCLTMLAGMTPSFHHFEVAQMRNRVLLELGTDATDGATACIEHAAEGFSRILDRTGDARVEL